MEKYVLMTNFIIIYQYYEWKNTYEYIIFMNEKFHSNISFLWMKISYVYEYIDFMKKIFI